MTFEIFFVIILIAQGVIGIYSVRKIPNEDKYFKYAGFWLRLFAGFIDYIIIFVVSSIIGYIIGFALIPYFESDRAIGEFISIVGAIDILGVWLYYALMESSKHRATLGKMAVGIQVVDMAGNQISFWQATKRFFNRILSFLTLLLGGFGYFMMGWTKQKQALHDKIADCLVIRKNGQKTLTQDQPPGQEDTT